MNPNHWGPCTQLLAVLNSQITHILSVMGSAASTDHSDELVALCEQLAQNMAQASPVLQQHLRQGPAPDEVLDQLKSIQTNLGDLRTQMTVQSAAVGRALQVLFPANAQQNGYGGLGAKGWGGTRGAGHGYLKA